MAQAILRILAPPAVIRGGRILVEGRNVCAMAEDELRAFRWRDRILRAPIAVILVDLQCPSQVKATEKRYKFAGKTQMRSMVSARRMSILYSIRGFSHGRCDRLPARCKSPIHPVARCCPREPFRIRRAVWRRVPISSKWRKKSSEKPRTTTATHEENHGPAEGTRACACAFRYCNLASVVMMLSPWVTVNSFGVS